MDNLILLNNNQINQLLNKRVGETKFGEHIQTINSVCNIYDALKDLDVEYVIFGVSEDVGIFANYGKSGASTAWEATIKILLNTQSNAFINPNKVLILGEIDCTKEVEALKTLNQKKKKDIKTASVLTSKIDSYVTNTVSQIVKAGKTPIIVGGGHNNAYGNIKGSSLATRKAINVINFDAHTDFRNEEGRHSGNGFSYALSEGFLNKYFIFGIHENYTSQTILDKLNQQKKKIQYNTFEAINISKELNFESEMERALKHVSDKPFGIEIDCDAIENIPSSAMTPSGFSVNKARTFVNFFGNHKNATYLHICEAAPKKKQQAQVGKLITYLITDFIKAHGR